MNKKIIQIESINYDDFKKELSIEIAFQILNLQKKTNPVEDDTLLNREETAKLLGISTVTLWKWTCKNILPAFRMGKKIFYKKSEVLNALQKKNNF